MKNLNLVLYAFLLVPACSSPNTDVRSGSPMVATGSGGASSGGASSALATGGKATSAMGGNSNLGTGGSSQLGNGTGGGTNVSNSGGNANASGGAGNQTGGNSASGGVPSNGTGGASSGTGGQTSNGNAGAALNGQRWEVPENPTPPQGQETCVYKDATVAFGGTPGTTYTVVLHLRGVLEGKDYAGGTAEGTGLQFYRGGTPVTDGSWGPYNTVGFTVSAPMQTYYVNKAEADIIMDDAVYALDYMVTIQIAGGASIHLFSEDSNCNAVPNSQPITVPGVTGNGQLQFAQVDVVSVTAN